MANLTPELQKIHEEVRELAASYGLDGYQTIFELVHDEELNMIASYGGFPTRYPHWRFGMEYEQLGKSYTYGLSKIYELVINNDPCYAYLMRSNSITDQKLVMAHVYGHCDFFKNNYWFSKTNRKMVDAMANHGTRIRRYMDTHGVECVENFIDCVLSIDNLIDIHSPFIRRESKRRGGWDEPDNGADEVPVHKIKAKDYMDRYINPPAYLEDQKRMYEKEQAQSLRFPPEPVRDVLMFLRDNAPLERWQQDVVGLLLEEAYYFAPQAMTKIMNEGWAVYWHSIMMCRHLVGADEVITYCDHHAGTLGATPGQINPYKLGLELFRDIKERWDKGRFGLEYQRIEDVDQRRCFDSGAGLGLEKIFEVRKVFNDVTFVDEFLTAEFAEDQKLYVYGLNQRTGRYEIVDRDWCKVKEQLLWSLTNFGQPRISVVDANHENRGELYLYHDWNGVDLQFEMASETLKNVHTIWRRPVHIETRNEGNGLLLSYDGDEITHKELSFTEETQLVVRQAVDEDQD